MRFGFFFYLVLNFAGLLIASRLFDGIIMTSFAWAALAALVLTILHLVVRPIFILFTLPLTVMSMGLFLLVINGLMFWLAGNLLEGYQVHGFASALGGAIVVSILGILASWLAGSGREKPAARQRTQMFTFRPGKEFYTRQSQAGRTQAGGPAPKENDVVDLEVDESGQWKIKD